MLTFLREKESVYEETNNSLEQQKEQERQTCIAHNKNLNLIWSSLLFTLQSSIT